MRQFPIFLDLSDSRSPPLVVGGGPLALAKVRLLAKRAAVVTVACAKPEPGLVALAREGRVELRPLAGVKSLIAGRPLVIVASGEPDLDAGLSHHARSLGVSVNVPDRPELCTFALPAIVDRDPVTVAIGTAGLAPILATLLREDLERHLNPNLGRLARFAGRLREAVAHRLPVGLARRAFWERIFSGPAAEAVLDGREADAEAIARRSLVDAAAAGAPAGRVVLVGAGPGDPELLTLKAVRALKSADVVLHDTLMGPDVLDYARREALIVDVGKRKGCPSLGQAEINHLLIRYAREGKLVVRLKAGDPFVFGRGGEEVDALRSAGIEVDVVPGITAALAAAASAQIPLTERSLARTVTFISGHGPGRGALDLAHTDLKALASGPHTLAVYMAVSTLPALADELLAAGFRPKTPVLAVERAGQAGERRLSSTLERAASDFPALALKGPAVLIIGEVAGLPVAGPLERRAAPAVPLTEFAHA